MTAKAPAKKPAPKKAVARKSSKASKKTSSKLTSAQKHTAHVKHEQHVAHEKHLTAVGKAPKAAFAIGDWLPVCSAQALAQSLRLAGQRVTEDELLELHYLAGGSLEEAAGLGDVLGAAALFGLAGCRPLEAVPVVAGRSVTPAFAADAHAAVREDEGRGWARSSSGGSLPFDRVGDLGERSGDVARFCGREVVDAGLILRPEDFDCWPVDVRDAPEVAQPGRVDGRLVAAQALGDALLGHALILQVDAPGPHAVLATADGWWSWGELYSPWPARVVAAWAVSWE